MNPEKKTIASVLSDKESRDRILAEAIAEIKAKCGDGLIDSIPAYEWKTGKPLPKNKK